MIMIELHKETLTPEAKIIFPLFSHFKEDFYMAGGTGLALQIGHRISVDFDLFGKLSVKKTLLKKLEEVFRGRRISVLVNNPDELTVFVGEVKCTFLHYPFPTILPFVQVDPISLLSVKEILATKAYTIGRRSEIKDYVDMYIGLKNNHSSLSEIIDIAKQKYSEVFNDRLFLEQLVYCKDLEEVKINMINGNMPSKKEMIDYFSNIARDVI